MIRARAFRRQEKNDDRHGLGVGRIEIDGLGETRKQGDDPV